MSRFVSKEALLTDILEKQGSLIARIKEDGALVYANKAFASFFELVSEHDLGKSGLDHSKKSDLFGLVADIRLGRNIFTNMQKIEKETFKTACKEAIKTKNPQKFKLTRKSKNGLIRLEWEVVAIESANGVCCQLNGQNMSSLAATQDALNVVFQALEQTFSAVAITDINGFVVFVNKRFEKLFGFAKDEIYGKTLRVLRSEVTPSSTFRDIRKKILGGG